MQSLAVGGLGRDIPQKSNISASDGAVLPASGTYTGAAVGFIVIATGSADWTVTTKAGSVLVFTPPTAGQQFDIEIQELTIPATAEAVILI